MSGSRWHSSCPSRGCWSGANNAFHGKKRTQNRGFPANPPNRHQNKLRGHTPKYFFYCHLRVLRQKLASFCRKTAEIRAGVGFQAGNATDCSSSSYWKARKTFASGVEQPQCRVAGQRSAVSSTQRVRMCGQLRCLWPSFLVFDEQRGDAHQVVGQDGGADQ